MNKDYLFKTLKIVVAAVLAIIVAGEIGLKYYSTAGIITVLSIQNTKRETLKTALNRACSYVCAIGLAAGAYYLMGFTLWAFGVYLFIFVLLCMVVGWKDGIVAMAFDGWYLDSEFTQPVNTDYVFYENVTLYAKWSPKENGYYVYFMDFAREGQTPLVLVTYSVTAGRTASPYTPGNAPEGKQWNGKWYLDNDCTNAFDFNTAINANITLYAKWTPKTYTITLNANDGASNGSATATYNSSTITNLTHPTRTDYRCNGYYTAASGGTLVLNIDGTLAKNVSGYTDANGNWTKDGDATLYAQWTYDVTEYTVTFGVGTDFSSYGSVTAKNNSESATITSPATVRSGQNITFTATPKTGYEVEGWYTNVACTTGKHNAGNTTYTTTITAATNVYVKFVEKTWSVAFAASTPSFSKVTTAI